MSRVEFTIDSHSFSNLEVSVILDGKSFPLVFSFSHRPNFKYSDIAIALSSIVGSSCTEIVFNFEVNEAITKRIGSWTNSQIKVRGYEDYSLPPLDDSVVLNFSGGFDSLAASYLPDRRVYLTSVDLGGRFSREYRFFSNYETLVVHTNVLETPLKGRCWAFLGMAPLFYRQIIPSKYFTFGSILEASSLKREPPAARIETFPPFAISGYQSAPYVQGLSEVGTLLILLQSCPENIGASIQSLANPGEEKFSRKIALTNVVADHLGKSVDSPDYPDGAKVHYEFGDSLAVDLTALYLLSEGREDLAMKLVLSVPDEVTT